MAAVGPYFRSCSDCHRNGQHRPRYTASLPCTVAAVVVWASVAGDTNAVAAGSKDCRAS